MANRSGFTAKFLQMASHHLVPADRSRQRLGCVQLAAAVGEVSGFGKREQARRTPNAARKGTVLDQSRRRLLLSR